MLNYRLKDCVNCGWSFMSICKPSTDLLDQSKVCKEHSDLECNKMRGSKPYFCKIKLGFDQQAVVKTDSTLLHFC